MTFLTFFVHFYSVVSLNAKKKKVTVSTFFAVFNSLRVYTPPDPPGYFDGYVWPMYLKNREEIESDTSEFGKNACVMIRTNYY